MKTHFHTAHVVNRLCIKKVQRMRIPRLKCPQAYLRVEAHANLVKRCVPHVDQVNVTLGMGIVLFTVDVFQINLYSRRGRYSCR